MSEQNKHAGRLLAAAAALAFASAPTLLHAANEAKVRCDGVNACKGQSACQTANNGCAGQNACKGQGYLQLTKAECDAAKQKMKKGKGDGEGQSQET